MPKCTLLILVLVVAALITTGCSGGGNTPVTPTVFIKIITPNGGEKFLLNSDQEITWVSQYIDGTVFIEYSRDNFVSDINLIAADEPNDGSFIWENIPSEICHTVRVRVSWTDYPDVNDISDADFAIIGPWIEVLSPNGGEVWGPGTDEEITWTSQGVTDTVFIEYSKDNFVNDVNIIAADEPNDGSFIWQNIPTDFSDTVRVRVSWTDYPDVNDISDADFTNIGPWIEVLSPNGGEVWGPGTDEEITWTSQGVIGTVLIEYSKDNFVSDINLLAFNEPNDDSFMWKNIPSDFSDNIRVRISWTDHPDVTDISDDVFSIDNFGWARTLG